MNGMLLLLFAAAWCRCCPSELLRDFILVRQKALLLFLAFCSSGTTAAVRDEESVADPDPDRDHEHITSPPKPAMFELDCRAGPSRPQLWWRGDFNWFAALSTTNKSAVMIDTFPVTSYKIKAF